MEERDGACETAEGFDEEFELALSELATEARTLVSESERWWSAWRAILFFIPGWYGAEQWLEEVESTG